MSIQHRFVIRVSALLGALSLAGVAAARRPPALVEEQARADEVYATCGAITTRTAPGYRDMLGRFPGATPLHTTAKSSPLKGAS